METTFIIVQYCIRNDEKQGVVEHFLGEGYEYLYKEYDLYRDSKVPLQARYIEGVTTNKQLKKYKYAYSVYLHTVKKIRKMRFMPSTKILKIWGIDTKICPIEKWTLPSGLEELVFPVEYDHEVPTMAWEKYYWTLKNNMLPDSIKKLDLGNCFSKKESKALPKNLIELRINGLSNDIELPRSLKYLFVKDSYLYDFEKLPELHTLYISFLSFKTKFSFLPKSLRELSICSRSVGFESFYLDLKQLPDNLTNLDIYIGSIKELSWLPPKLESLMIRGLYDKTLFLSYTAVPLLKNLKVLKINNYCNSQIYPGDLPESLCELYLGENFNHPILDGSIPKNVRTIYYVNPEYDKYNNDKHYNLVKNIAWLL